jgi:hypothetical protein
MGSWYKTCGLSQLPIIDYAEVVVVPLKQNTDRSDRCYSTAFWMPNMLPFYAKYADYGRGDNETGAALPYIIDGIRNVLTEVEIGDNKSHDIAVKRADFDVELFYEAVHEGRLYKADWQGKPQMIDYVMLRKDIVDDILANFKREMYMGNGMGDCGYGNSYRMIDFDTILADLPEFMMAVQKSVDDLKSDDITIRTMAQTNACWGGFDRLFDQSANNLVAKYVRGDGYRYAGFGDVCSIIYELMAKGEAETAADIMIDHLMMQYLNCYMETTRRNWMPGGHEGSQNREMHGYRVMAEATLRALEREKAAYYADNEFDPDDVESEAYSEF